jgi:signal transduction histidine kinase
LKPLRILTGTIVETMRRSFTEQVLQLETSSQCLSPQAKEQNEVAHKSDLRPAVSVRAQELTVVLATVSHELRRPLAAILGWTQLLRSGRSTEIARGLEVIERSANQLGLLLDELVEVSHPTSTPVIASADRVDLNAVLRNVVDAAQPAAAERQVQIVSRLRRRQMLVQGDSKRMHQIFGNLVANAIKFTPDGGRVTLSLFRKGDDVEVEVKDTGIGIPQADLPRIFEPFWQAAATCDMSQGLGLGLPLVRRLVELHRGTVEAKSAGPAQGTRMIVRLPLTQTERRNLSRT